jgi:hypothetical protein
VAVDSVGGRLTRAGGWPARLTAVTGCAPSPEGSSTRESTAATAPEKNLANAIRPNHLKHSIRAWGESLADGHFAPGARAVS